MNIVWFKRDLRIVDHEALVQASERGPLLPLYIFEPELWKEPDMSQAASTFFESLPV
jgi:deoxyribodipyrimidine photo-lyase